MAAVDGLISGMDTTTVIQQLLELERLPQLRLEQKQKTYEAKVMAYQTVNAKLLSLQTASDALTKAETWRAFKVDSSSSSVSATASTTALTGSHSFEVVALAKAHAEMSSHVFTSTAEQAAAAASTITITKDDGTSMDVAAGDGSLATVVANINAADGEVKAAAVQVAPGEYRLSLSSTTSGLASKFEVTGLDHATQDIVVGADAELGMGALVAAGPPPEYDIMIRSSSNTFTDVLPGVTFTVSKLESVTLDVTTDGAGIAAKVQAMVSAANGVLDEIDKQTAFNATTNTKSALTGDSTVRSLQQRILSMGAGFGNVSLADAGIEVTKEGRFEFSAAAFTEAYEADPVGTEARFRPGGVADATGVSFVYAGDRLSGGSYAVDVTRVAERAEIRVAGTVTDGDTYTVRVPGKDAITVTAAGDTMTTVADKINTALSGLDLGVIAAMDANGDLLVRSTSYGSTSSLALDVVSTTATATSSVARLASPIAGTEVLHVAVAGFPTLDVAAEPGDTVELLATRLNTQLAAAGIGLEATVRHGAVVVEPSGATPESFTIAITGGTMTSHVAGVDVEGTIAGVVATGTGRTLAAPVDDAILQGLTFTVTAAAPVSGEFTYSPGIAQRFDSLAGDAIRTESGLLTTVIEGGQRAIDGLRDQIEGWDQRLETRERMLRRQFATLETTLGNLRNQSNWLAGQLSGLAANNG